MKYKLEFFRSCAFVSAENLNGDCACLELPSERVQLSVTGAHVNARNSAELSRFMRRLSNDRDILNRQKATHCQNPDWVEWRCVGTSVSAVRRVNVGKLISRLEKFYCDVAPSIALAKVILEQTRRRPLTAETDIRFLELGEVDGVSIERWLDIRKQAGKEIDPTNAVTWTHSVQTLDPYGIFGKLPAPISQVGKDTFVRSAGGDIWVLFEDLPKRTQKAFHKRWAEEKSKRAARRETQMVAEEEVFFEL